MMPWSVVLIFLYISYYTLRYAIRVWKEENKLAGAFIIMLGLGIGAMSVWLHFYIK